MKKALLFSMAFFAVNIAMAQNTSVVNQIDVMGNPQINDALIMQTGDGNHSVVEQELLANGGAVNDNIVNVDQDGDDNRSNVYQEAFDGHNTNVNQDGNRNRAEVDLYRNHNITLIEQLGNDNRADQWGSALGATLLIDQDGNRNRAFQTAGGESDPNWHVLGTGNAMSSVQDGNDNLSRQSILNHGSVGHLSSTGNTAIMTQDGNNNRGIQIIGASINGDPTSDPDNNMSMLDQDGNNNFSRQTQLGDGNYSDVTQTGNGHHSITHQLGDGGVAVVIQN